MFNHHSSNCKDVVIYPKKDRVEQDVNSYLCHLPDHEILQKISQNLPDLDLRHLQHCSFFMYQSCDANINERALLKLLISIAHNDIMTVIKILNNKPKLLITDPNKTLIVTNSKTWQKFYAEKPLKMLFKNPQIKMLKTILPYFQCLEEQKLINSAIEEILSQWHEARKEMTQRPKWTKSNFYKIVDTISYQSFANKSNNDQLIYQLSVNSQTMLDEFRNSLLPSKAISLNNYIDVKELLDMAYEVYEEKFNQFSNSDQRVLYCIGIIGFLQSLVTPEFAERLCEGYINGSKPFYRPSPDSKVGLGFTYLFARQGIPISSELKLGSHSLFTKHYQCLTSEFNELIHTLETKSVANLKKQASSNCILL